jgi:hypothetical protein
MVLRETTTIVTKKVTENVEANNTNACFIVGSMRRHEEKRLQPYLLRGTS